MAVLAPLPLTAEVSAQWATVGAAALEADDLVSAERCYACAGDVSRAQFLHKVQGGGGLCLRGQV